MIPGTDARKAIVDVDYESFGSAKFALEKVADRVNEKFARLDWAITVALAVPALLSKDLGALTLPAVWKACPNTEKMKLLRNFLVGYDVVDLMKRKPKSRI